MLNVVDWKLVPRSFMKPVSTYWRFLESVDNGRPPVLVSFHLVEQWKKLPWEEIDIVIVLQSEHSNDNVIKVWRLELQNWKSFNAYDVVPGEEQPHVTTIRVVMEKIIDCESTIEARLMATGFQESPTAHKSTLQIIFTIAAIKSCKV